MTNIYTYHYVRSRQAAGGRDRFAGLRVRSVDEFDDQLRLIDSTRCVSLSKVIGDVERAAVSSDATYALTFDDGFSDHYTTVYPRLRRLGVTGAFFPIAGGSLHGRLLDVHKIQLVLATGRPVDDLRRLATEFLEAEGCAQLVGLLEPDVSSRDTGGRFDQMSVRSLKRALQAELPSAVRTATVDHLYAKFVGEDQAAVAAELYAGVDQLQEMARGGMEIGGHSVHHHHLDTLSDDDLRIEIDGSLELLDAVASPSEPGRIFCYPYGSYDERVVAAVNDAGFTAAVGVAEGPVLPSSDVMALPRWDTNKLPAVVADQGSP